MSWINVKDKLPEDHQTVLACEADRYGSTYVLAVMGRNGWRADSEGLEASNYDGGAVIDIDSGLRITHWMPLPDPPEEE